MPLRGAFGRAGGGSALRAAWALAIATLGIVAPAGAQPALGEPPRARSADLPTPDFLAYRFSEEPAWWQLALGELPFVAVGAAGLAVQQTARPASAGSNNGDNPFDDPWAPDGKKRRTIRHGADGVSDVTGGIAGPVIFGAALGGLDLTAHWLNQAHFLPALGGAARSLMISGEAALVGFGLAEGLKALTWRCRPSAYLEPDADHPKGRCEDVAVEGEAEGAVKAFPSGHTLPISSVAGAALVTALRTPWGSDSGLRWVGFVLTESAAVVTAAFRVHAGYHSLSDVGAAWLFGHLAGAGVALAHPMAVAAQSPDAAGRRFSIGVGDHQLTLSGRF